MRTYVKNSFLLLFLCLAQIVYGQGSDDMVRGKVIEKSTGEPLLLVTVAEVDGNNRVVNGVPTNMEGEFAIRIKSPKNKLRVTYLGFITQTVSIGDKRNFTIQMEEDSHTLETVEIVARQTQNTGALNIPTREISTAVQKISTEEFEGIQVASIDDALQGRIAGLDIVSNSGEPGTGMSMRIRGTSTITGNAEPLIVVNDIPFEADLTAGFEFNNATDEQYANLISVNPDDIESITVLKDAASTAIYGSKGANGVILIYTKKGATGRTRVNYTYRGTAAWQPKGMNLLNGDDYTMLMKQAYYNVSLDPYATSDINEFNYNTNFSEYQNFNNNTDWVKAVSQTGWTNSHNIAVSGGGDRARFRISGEMYDQKGTVIGQNLKRFSTRSYLEYDVSDRIKFISEFAYTYSDNDKNYVDDRDAYKASILDIAYRKMPNVSIYAQDADGVSTGEYYNILQSSNLDNSQKNLMNPVALANLGKNNEKNYRIMPTLRLEYFLLDPTKAYLKYKVYVAFDMNNVKISRFLPKEVSSYAWDNESVNRSESKDTEALTVQTENSITWQFSKNDHFLTMLGAFQTKTANSEAQRLLVYGVPNINITDASAAAYLNTAESNFSSGRSIGIIGTAHYSYKSRYILGLSYKRDGSSRFGKGYQYGDFYGLSGKWIMSDEKFWDSLRGIVNEFAFRPSYGLTGNQPTQEYLAFSRYGYYSDAGYIDMIATRPSSLQLTDLRWEKSKSVNLGLDLHFFDSKFASDFNYYKTRTSDLLFEKLAIPSSSGYSQLRYQNVGTLDNEGWEFNAYANNIIKTKDFSVSFSVNFSNSVNTIVKLSDEVLNAVNSDFSGANGEYLTRIQEGNSFGSIYGFKYKGVYQYDEYNEELGYTNAPVARDQNGNVIYNSKGEPKRMVYQGGNAYYEFRGGDAIYEDINNDGSIDELDIVYLGNSNPKLNGGFGATLRYKNFSCNMFFNFRYGNKIINTARMKAENMYSNDNQSIAVNWRWRKDGDMTDMPRALYNYGYNWLGSDRYVEDGSFLRFKYLTFNYSVPRNFLRQFGLNQLTTYVTFNNLYCFTKYTGVDPEVSYTGNGFNLAEDKSKTPRSKDFTIGVTIGF